MDYDLIPNIDDLSNNDSAQPNLSLTMTPLITDNTNNPTMHSSQQHQHQQQQPLLWNSSADLNTLEEMLGVQRPPLPSNASATTGPSFPTNNNMIPNQVNSFLAPPMNQPSDSIPSQLDQQNFLSSLQFNPDSLPAPPLTLSKPLGDGNITNGSCATTATTATGANTSANTNNRKRKYPCKDENDQQPETNNSNSDSNTTSDSTTLTGNINNDSSDNNNANKIPGIVSLNEPLIIDQNMLIQLGGLPYAELCKERAREAFKEAKKNEHLANGNFDRMKRRKKGDTSMTPREKYVRRLRMNQDSAAAARHAQEVYVSVLERLVRTSEVEKKSFIAEVQQVRSNSDHLKSKFDQMSARVKMLEKQNQQYQQQLKAANKPVNNNVDNDLLDEKKNNPALLKFLDLFKDTASVGAQPDIGVQPARAV